MNKVSPKTLLNSKWTKVDITNKEKHFMIVKVKFDDEQHVTECIIQAIMTHNEYHINWRDLKHKKQWILGWK